MTDDNLAGSDDWTPWQGIRRGLVWGFVAAVALGAVADVLAWYMPTFVINFWLRTAAGLLTMWVLFSAVHRAAGMTGPACTAIVVVLGMLIAGSQHIIFATHGVPTGKAVLTGWICCSAGALAWWNVSTAIGMAWRDGATLGSLTDIARLKVWGGR
jgi:hypothetical protein